MTTIGVKVRKDADIARIEEKLYALPDVQVVSLSQVKETIMSLVSTAKVLVLSIAIIAILIAMVGVVNTILMSVHERFQEIGILKTIGAMPLGHIPNHLDRDTAPLHTWRHTRRIMALLLSDNGAGDRAPSCLIRLTEVW